MTIHRPPSWTLLLACGVLVTTAGAASAPGDHAARRAEPARKSADAGSEPVLEPKAIDLLKAASDRLAAARAMRFTAVVSYESPSSLGPPLIYTTRSDVVMKRPDKLRVITSADGPASEFYYDGATMTAFEPTANLAAVAEAPPTVDAALKVAYDSAAIYFPFSDVIVSDPYHDIADGLTRAFYIGQSHVVGGTTTDMIAYTNGAVFVQAWIGTEDKLPRMVRAVYRDDPSQLRHQMELSDWWIDVDIPPGVFTSSKAAAAPRIPFARPDLMPRGLEPPKRKPPKAH
jgi:hypothetical protein